MTNDIINQIIYATLNENVQYVRTIIKNKLGIDIDEATIES